MLDESPAAPQRGVFIFTLYTVSIHIHFLSHPQYPVVNADPARSQRVRTLRDMSREKGACHVTPLSKAQGNLTGEFAYHRHETWSATQHVCP